MAELALQTVLRIKTISCARCGCTIGLESSYENQRREDHATFYCPNGHPQHFPGESDVEKAQRLLRDEQARHAKTLARENEERAEKDKLARKLKRVGRGVCPECQRSFQNLARHMQCKHKP